jgi:CRISPR/Cas system CMR-associated protein Cmr1 (group 7 of RAMP superfamily)
VSYFLPYVESRGQWNLYYSRELTCQLAVVGHASRRPGCGTLGVKDQKLRGDRSAEERFDKLSKRVNEETWKKVQMLGGANG